jgi:hypothetical protein
MILIYINNNHENLELLISNVNIFLSKSKLLNKQFNIIIYSKQNIIINHNIKIISTNFIYENIENIEYEYIIEIDDHINLNIFLSYEFNINNNITCNYTNNKLEYYFTKDEIKLLSNISKKKFINIDVDNILDSIKIYNINNLKKVNWFNTMQYLHNKCNELNIDINNKKLLILFQLLYPQYIQLEKFEEHIEDTVEEHIEDIVEINIQEKIQKPNVWLIKQSACKKLLTNYVICLEDTYLKKNRVKENKRDPTDKIFVRIGKKFKLSYMQNLNYFYIVEF